MLAQGRLRKQEILLQTEFLPRLTRPWADALTGRLTLTGAARSPQNGFTACTLLAKRRPTIPPALPRVPAAARVQKKNKKKKTPSHARAAR